MDNENLTMLTVPVLPLRGLVIFPGSILHFDVARKKSILALTTSINSNQYIFITAQKKSTNNDPTNNELYSVGVLAKVVQVAQMPNNVVRVVAEGLFRAKAYKYDEQTAYFQAQISELEIKKASNSEKIEAMINTVKNLFEDFATITSQIPQDIVLHISETYQAGELADYIADNIIRDYHKKQEILETINEEKRLEKIIKILKRENNVLMLEEKISNQTDYEIESSRREYYLREKLKVIRDELGDNDDFINDIEEYRNKVNNLKTTEENKDKLLQEIQKLEKMSNNSAEVNILRNYIDTCIELPWGIYTKEKSNINKIATYLDKQHYGLKKVKDNIIEELAVKQLNPNVNGQIICLVGPPGVGKTSIAHSIADATGRRYQRIALGGVHDEAEIRGHRRTYIGAMIGRIMSAIKQANSANPLILLDEIDKLGNDFHGDPTSALLEVLDGEQNSTFYDHYIDLPFDLSKVLFITTANDYTAIPEALRDRMDIINIESYTREEKFNIASKHLIYKQQIQHGLNSKQFKIPNNVIYDIIDSYTCESGVRSLERTISKLMNKIAFEIVSKKVKSVKITTNNIEDYLGSRKFRRDTINLTDEVGVATGLAWTSVGGETLPIEVAIMPGTGKLELTGSLGDVMKESAHVAYTCVRSMSIKLGIEKDFYKNKDIHIHIPEGAVPKDGPSAGITIVTAIVSALTKIPVRKDVAMTGEVTIRGRVLSIGGLKEKTMAAYRLGIKTVIVPKNNKSDLDDLDEIIKKSINFIYADNIDIVLSNALVSNIKGED